MHMVIQQPTQEELNKLRGEHPVVTKDYLIITPVITNVYSLIRERVFMRKTGTFMYATPRMGKTTCARAVEKLLQHEFPKILIMRLIAEDSGRQEAALLINILQTGGIYVRPRISYVDAQRQLLTHIQNRLALLEGNQFVLLIDEMQHLEERELDRLAALHNKLEALNIRMTAVGFAQPEVLDIRSTLTASNKSYLIARFLCEPIPFMGCASIEDLEQILSDYDEMKYFPEDSDYSYTRFFLPAAFENGFRLRDYAKPIWKELKKATGKYADSIPMEHLSRTVEFLLVALQKLDSDSFAIRQEHITAAVEASSLAIFSGLMEVSEPH